MTAPEGLHRAGRAGQSEKDDGAEEPEAPG